MTASSPSRLLSAAIGRDHLILHMFIQLAPRPEELFALRRNDVDGDRAEDPKSTQVQLRHADPTLALKHYHDSIPESVKAAAVSPEADL